MELNNSNTNKERIFMHRKMHMINIAYMSIVWSYVTPTFLTFLILQIKIKKREQKRPFPRFCWWNSKRRKAFHSEFSTEGIKRKRTKEEEKQKWNNDVICKYVFNTIPSTLLIWPYKLVCIHICMRYEYSQICFG